MEDQYPLPRLVRLLCFEDESEALEACRFYNITVEESQTSSSPSIVYWKRSTFREPKDPEKGFVLSLKPRKMIRTIESKLNGATRLAVCRGEVSGAGASLSRVPHRSAPNAGRVTTPIADYAERVDSQLAEPKFQPEQQHQMEEQAAKRRMEERRRLREEEKIKEEEKRQLEETERRQKEEAERQALILRKQREEEMKRKQAEEEEEARREQAEEERRRKLELEDAKRAAEAAAREEQLRREADEKRLAAERAEADRRAEAERLERLRQEELRRKREDEERLERIRLEEEARRRREEERRREEQLRLQRERKEQERKMREEEARRIAEAREAEMNQARKLLIWRRLRSTLDRELRNERTRQSLSRIDPTFSSNRPALVNLCPDTDPIPSYDMGIDAYTNLLPGIHILDCLCRQSSSPLNLSAMLRKVLYSYHRNAPCLPGAGEVVLAKVAVALPTFVGPKADAMQSLLHSWIGRKLQYRHVVIDPPSGKGPSCEIRTVSSNGDASTVDCDMAILVIPPFFGDDSRDVYSSVKFPHFDRVVPRAILCLDNGENEAYAEVVNKLLSSVLNNVPFIQVGDELRADLFEVAFEESCDALLHSFAEESAEGSTRDLIVRLSIAQLASRCIRSALWRGGLHTGTDAENAIMDRARGTMLAMLAEFVSFSTCNFGNRWRRWPAREFVNKKSVVRDYFGHGFGLPGNWKDSLSLSEVEPAVMELYQQLNCSFRDVICTMMIDAPEQVKQDCREMLAKRQFRRCFEYVLMWRESNHEPSLDETVIYLPTQNVSDIVEGCVQRLEEEEDDDNDFLENVSEQLEDVDETNENVFAVESIEALPSPAIGTPFRMEESFPRYERLDSPAFDESQPLAESSRTPDGNIMRPPVGVQTPASPPVGVQTPMTLPDDLLRGSKRLLNSDNEPQKSKRRRSLSKNQQESIDFTRKLEAMLHGETLPDVKVGNAKLSELLRNAPDIKLP